ncbi:MAG: hypothetical protein JST79_06055 [Acidobacteria bacterium]|jgi:hypothetical protein|nr:hypothetical protein [Acidobacteriota bacterium]
MQCQVCGAMRPTAKISFAGIIGMIVAYRYFYIKGAMCKSCLHKKFVEYTLPTVGLGWLGLMSLMATPFLVAYNVVRYGIGLVQLRESRTTRPAFQHPSQFQPAAVAAQGR